jgi:hypothetical protein
MMQGVVGPYHHFDGPQPIDPGTMYRPLQPQLNQAQIYEAIPIKHEDQSSIHSMDTISQADSMDDARQHCNTPSETSQDARPDVFMQTVSSSSSEQNEIGDKEQQTVVVPIISSNAPEGLDGEGVNAEKTNQATLLSLSGPPYNFVVAHYPQAHFGTADKRPPQGETYSFVPSSEMSVATGLPFGNIMTTASDQNGVPQFYAMKCTPNKNGEIGQEMMSSPFRLEQPFFTDRPANDTSPFSVPKHLPNEFIEQIAKQFYLLQGGEKLLSPTVLTAPNQGRGEHQSPGRVVSALADQEHPLPASIASVKENDRQSSAPASESDVTENDNKSYAPASDITENDSKSSAFDITENESQSAAPASDVTENENQSPAPVSGMSDVIENDPQSSAPASGMSDLTENDPLSFSPASDVKEIENESTAPGPDVTENEHRSPAPAPAVTGNDLQSSVPASDVTENDNESPAPSTAAQENENPTEMESSETPDDGADTQSPPNTEQEIIKTTESIQGKNACFKGIWPKAFTGFPPPGKVLEF